MAILKNKTCPMCGAPNSLFVCILIASVNCNNCYKFTRSLTKEEIERLVKFLFNLPELLIKKAKEKK